MKILITLDYELFLGSQTGTVQKCLIDPISQLLKISDKYGVKYTLFVDAVYLYKLLEYSDKYNNLRKDFNDISYNLKYLNQLGHDIQLHIHPHWFFSNYDGKQWILDNDYYKLSDLSIDESNFIFTESKKVLDNILGHKTIAYRAGGFSAQTENLEDLFRRNDILIDSSVYPNNYYNSSYQKYDYRNCPNKSFYYFNNDICKEVIDGDFMEVPLSTYKLSPYFYWKLALTKLMKNNKHNVIGDGKSVKTDENSIIERLTTYSDGFLTIDGYKINYLINGIKSNIKKGNNILNIIGHPKLQTQYSINKFDKILSKLGNAEFITLSNLYKTKKSNEI